MRDWFTIEKIDETTFAISEYRHWEKTHSYLLVGRDRCLLIDTGLGICNIYDAVRKLSDKHITAVATHIHWDHMGGHKYFADDFYAHKAELDWLNGKYPLPINTVRGILQGLCDDLPEDFDIDGYQLFRGVPSEILNGGEIIDIGDRKIEVLHTPGHSPGHMCFFEADRGYLYTGDLIYKESLFAYYPSTDPEQYLASLEKVALIPSKRLLPAHHSLDIGPDFALCVRDAFREIKAKGELRHGTGRHDFDGFYVWL